MFLSCDKTPGDKRTVLSLDVEFAKAETKYYIESHWLNEKHEAVSVACQTLMTVNQRNSAMMSNKMRLLLKLIHVGSTSFS